MKLILELHRHIESHHFQNHDRDLAGRVLLEIVRQTSDQTYRGELNRLRYDFEEIRTQLHSENLDQYSRDSIDHLLTIAEYLWNIIETKGCKTIYTSYPLEVFPEGVDYIV